ASWIALRSVGKASEALCTKVQIPRVPNGLYSGISIGYEQAVLGMAASQVQSSERGSSPDHARGGHEQRVWRPRYRRQRVYCWDCFRSASRLRLGRGESERWLDSTQRGLDSPFPRDLRLGRI